MRRDARTRQGRAMNQIPRSALVPAALLAGLCPLVANSIHADVGGSGAEIIAQASASRSATEMIAIALLLLAFAALVVVLGILVSVIAHRSPAVAGVVGVAGASAVAIKLSEAQTGVALREAAGVVDPGTAEALVAMDEAGFAVYGFLLSLSLGAAGVGLLRSGVVPAWLGWWAAVMGGLGVLTAAIGIVLPPNYVPLPFVLLLLWLVALGLTAVRRPLAPVVPGRAVVASQ